MDAFRIIAIGLAAGLAFAPLAYCTVKDGEAQAGIKRACIENGGLWTNTWGGRCEWKETPHDRP